MSREFHNYIAVSIIALCGLLIAGGIATFRRADKNKGRQSVLPPAHRQLLALPIGAERTILAPHGYRGPCHSCHPVANAPSTAPLTAKSVPNIPPPVTAPVPGWLFQQPGRRPDKGDGATAPLTSSRPTFGPFTDTGVAAFSVPQGGGSATGLLTPIQQNAADKMMVEGHWMGMETLDLTPALSKIYQLPVDVSGVIVDEITLESAESGILAGDVIISIQGRPTRNLGEFFQATRAVSEREKAEVVVYRLGQEERFVVVAKNAPTLGFAQMEGASPIRPGALSPHRKRQKGCTNCHVIMTTGGQLPIDAGDVLPSPPPIAPNAKAPHAYRGVCNSCHVIEPAGGQPAATAGGKTLAAPPITANAVAPHAYRGECNSCHVIR